MDEHEIEIPAEAVTPPPPLTEARSIGRVPETIAVAPRCECGGGGGADCACKGGNGAAKSRYAYALGTVRFEFPSTGLQYRFSAAAALIPGTPPDNVLQWDVLNQGDMLNVARALCWKLQIGGVVTNTGGVDAYLIAPRSYVELYALIEAVKPGELQVPPAGAEPRLALIVGSIGPVAPPEVCNGLQLPIVSTDQVVSFTFSDFVNSIVRQTGIDTVRASSIFKQLLEVSDNAGELDEHRAINYITLRYLDTYTNIANKELENRPLTAVTAQAARVQGARRIVDVLLQFTWRGVLPGTPPPPPLPARGVEYLYAKVDVTEEYPFLVAPWSVYYPAP